MLETSRIVTGGLGMSTACIIGVAQPVKFYMNTKNNFKKITKSTIIPYPDSKLYDALIRFCETYVLH